MKTYLTANMKNEFIDYSNAYINSNISEKTYPYLNNRRLDKVFDVWVERGLYCTEKGTIAERNMKSGDFWSKYSVPETLEIDEIIDELFHHVFCQAEWACRCMDDIRFVGSAEAEYTKKFINELREM